MYSTTIQAVIIYSVCYCILYMYSIITIKCTLYEMSGLHNLQCELLSYAVQSAEI